MSLQRPLRLAILKELFEGPLSAMEVHAILTHKIALSRVRQCLYDMNSDGWSQLFEKSTTIYEISPYGRLTLRDAERKGELNSLCYSVYKKYPGDTNSEQAGAA